jgi:hypothetical protein
MNAAGRAALQESRTNNIKFNDPEQMKYGRYEPCP